MYCYEDRANDSCLETLWPWTDASAQSQQHPLSSLAFPEPNNTAWYRVEVNTYYIFIDLYSVPGRVIRFWEDRRKRHGLYPWVFRQLRAPSRLALQGSSSDRCPLVLWMYLHTHTPFGQPRCVSWSEYKLIKFSHWRASWLMTHDLVILFLIYHLYLSGWIGLCYLY